MGQKSKSVPFFSDLHGKITLLMLKFCRKNVNYLKNTLLSCPNFAKKRQFSQKQCALMSFFQFFQKTPTVVPIICQTTSILSKLYYIMDKQINRMPFLFWFFTLKSQFSCPYFVKTSILWKTRFLCPYLKKKHPFSQKHNALISFFTNFPWKTLSCNAHICFKKSEFFQK